MSVPPRFFKYAIITFCALLTVALWTRSELLPTISQYAIIAEDSIGGQEPFEHPQHHENNEDVESDSDDSSNASFGLDVQEEPSSYDSPASPSSPQAAAPSSSGKPAFPRFAKITATFGEPDPPYEEAIASHKLHNEIHNYPQFILREQMLKGLWSKHAYILSIIGNELAKPLEERLEWVLWHDRDTVLMNPQLPLDIFVPPSPAFNHIHFLVTNDHNGLNNGVFLCRVSGASFKFFASALSFREYRPEVMLKYTEQSGMEEVIKSVRCSTPHSLDSLH